MSRFDCDEISIFVRLFRIFKSTVNDALVDCSAFYMRINDVHNCCGNAANIRITTETRRFISTAQRGRKQRRFGFARDMEGRMLVTVTWIMLIENLDYIPPSAADVSVGKSSWFIIMNYKNSL